MRRGDRVRVADTGREAIYWVTTQSGEVVVAAEHYREETVAKAGTVRLKGGILDSWATVTVLARGPEWK